MDKKEASEHLHAALRSALGSNPGTPDHVWNVMTGPTRSRWLQVLVRYICDQKPGSHHVIGALQCTGIDWGSVQIEIEQEVGSLLHFIVASYWSKCYATNKAFDSMMYALHQCFPNERTNHRRTPLDIITTKESFNLGNPYFIDFKITDKVLALKEFAYDAEFATILLEHGAFITVEFVKTFINARHMVDVWSFDKELKPACDLLFRECIDPLAHLIETLVGEPLPRPFGR